MTRNHAVMLFCGWKKRVFFVLNITGYTYTGSIVYVKTMRYIKMWYADLKPKITEMIINIIIKLLLNY